MKIHFGISAKKVVSIVILTSFFVFSTPVHAMVDNQQYIGLIRQLISLITQQIQLLQEELKTLKVQEEKMRKDQEIIVQPQKAPETYRILVCGSERYDSRYEYWRPKFPLYTQQGFSAYKDIYEINSLNLGWITEYECREQTAVIK